MSITSQRSAAAHPTQDQPSISSDIVEEFRFVCRDAWKQGLLSGCNGNASRRLGSHAPGLICVTRSGAAKGRLTAADCCLMDIATGVAVSSGPASTESGMHLAIYRARPDCNAILHTHPRRLLALSLRLAGRQEDFLRLPLFEAEVWRAKLGFSPAPPPPPPAQTSWPRPWPLPPAARMPCGWPGTACAALAVHWPKPCVWQKNWNIWPHYGYLPQFSAGIAALFFQPASCGLFCFFKCYNLQKHMHHCSIQ